MSYYVYILKSEVKDRYYIGSCSDVEKRLERHNAGATPSTKPYRPWQVVYIEEYLSKTESLKREKYIKRMKSKTYIELLIIKNKE
ncbi:GIY-YIG nuclease family protein [Saccharicrinis sp. FJH54]|uniref:GIY-YIG nuclease family protein n=1 Tax=Saccharicrinis sp. FJH54 TaxID=3344665 RepID=UPI0035D525B3